MKSIYVRVWLGKFVEYQNHNYANSIQLKVQYISMFQDPL